MEDVDIKAARFAMYLYCYLLLFGNKTGKWNVLDNSFAIVCDIKQFTQALT